MAVGPPAGDHKWAFEDAETTLTVPETIRGGGRSQIFGLRRKGPCRQSPGRRPATPPLTMLTYLRYALATFCFAASVGCLALWSLAAWLGIYFYAEGGNRYLGSIHLESHAGAGILTFRGPSPNLAINNGWIFSRRPAYLSTIFLKIAHSHHGLFGQLTDSYYFPLWYPALIFALAGVGTLRLGRRFTIRSALIATTIVAVLLGMVVVL